VTSYLLDTDTLSLYRRGNRTVIERVEACDPELVGTTVITVEEQLTGWYSVLRKAKGREQQAHAYAHLTETVSFLSRVRIVTFDVPAIERFEKLDALRLNIGKMDLRIAAIVLEHGAVLVTRNTRDFARVPGLTVEDWSLPDSCM
jgi:tRNA(fMet)-specific endonuclease VapC